MAPDVRDSGHEFEFKKESNVFKLKELYEIILD